MGVASKILHTISDVIKTVMCQEKKHTKKPQKIAYFNVLRVYFRMTARCLTSFIALLHMQVSSGL